MSDVQCAELLKLPKNLTVSLKKAYLKTLFVRWNLNNNQKNNAWKSSKMSEKVKNLHIKLFPRAKISYLTERNLKPVWKFAMKALQKAYFAEWNPKPMWKFVSKRFFLLNPLHFRGRKLFQYALLCSPKNTAHLRSKCWDCKNDWLKVFDSSIDSELSNCLRKVCKYFHA